MRVKLYSRNQIIINMMIFVVLSCAFLHVLESLQQGVSALNLDRVYLGLRDSWPYIILAIITLLLIGRAQRFSLNVYVVFCFFTLCKGFIIFFGHFDKLILALIFLYVIIAFYFYILWRLELNSAAYCPRFRTNEIEQRSLLSIYVEVKTAAGKKYSGYLTNWDESSCFVLFDSEYFPGRIISTVEVDISFDNSIFSQKGRIISGYGAGVGIEFYKTKASRFDMNWSHFYEIMADRGYLLQG